MNETTRKTFGLVLAGGKSRRMGQDKALLARGDRSQLAYMTELLGDCVDRVFVSTNPQQRRDPERERFEQIVDRYDDLGPVAGILSAIEEYPDVDWLIVACDLPNIDANTLQFLLQHKQTDKPFTAYASSFDKLPEPLCAIYHVGCRDIIQPFVDDGMVCPRKIMIRSDTQLLELQDPRSLDNVNTPDDLRDSVLRAV